MKNVLQILILGLLIIIVVRMYKIETTVNANNVYVEHIQTDIKELNKNVDVLAEKALNDELNKVIEDTEKIYKMIFELKPTIEEKLAEKLSSSIVEKSLKYELEPELVTAIILKESSFNPKAKSKVGCKGLMQVYPKFHKEKLKVRNIIPKDLYNIDHNIDVGCEILREYIDEHGDLKSALTKYSGYKTKKNKYVKEVLGIYKEYSNEG